MEIYSRKVKNAELGDFVKMENILNEDVDLYDSDTGEIVFLFRKNIINKSYYDTIHQGIINHSKTISNNRGNSAGKTTIEGLNKFQENWKPEAHPVALVDRHGTEISTKSQSSSSFFKYADGRLSKRARSNNVHSQALGGFDKSNIHPCRLTHWTGKNLEKYKTMYPICEKISEIYFSYFPDKYYLQLDRYKESPAEFLIPNSPFSTITLNCDFRTAVHEDRGDFKDGMTCFSVYESGFWLGGELGFPEYDIALNVRQGDLLIFNPHIKHCNNPLIGSGRVSFVFYMREKMNRCQANDKKPLASLTTTISSSISGNENSSGGSVDSSGGS
tara:strand:- start:84 stop:1073 length:990 start_codon:yes stop_codon:yes gene_type:complete